MKFINAIISLIIILHFYEITQFENILNYGQNQNLRESYFLKAKASGKWIEFHNGEQLSANFGPYIDNVYDGVISASNINEDDYSVLNSFSIIIRQKGQIGIGSYSGNQQFEYGLKA